MLKRVKRRASKHLSVEKPEDLNNSGKKDSSSDSEIFERVISELRTEVITLKEQLEREKKAANDVKSLKTQQICTLTFKLANAVRQRELAEGELAKVKREMEELKEEVKVQAEEMKATECEDGSDEKQEEDRAKECDAEEWEEVNKQEKEAKDNAIDLFFPKKDEKHIVNDFEETGEGSLLLENECDELPNENSSHENLPTEEFRQDILHVIEDYTKENSSIRSKSEHEDVFHLEALPQSSSSEMSDSKQDNSKEKEKRDLKEFTDENHKVNDFVENEEGYLLLENESDKLPNENSLYEHLPTEEFRQDIPRVVVSSQSSSSESSDKDYTIENSSIRSKAEDVFHIEAFPQRSSFAMSDPNQHIRIEKGKLDLKEFKDEKRKMNEFVENEKGSLLVENKCDELQKENSVHEHLPTAKECRLNISHIVATSQSSFSEMSVEDFTKGDSSIQSKSEDVFHIEALPQSSSSEMFDPNQDNSQEKEKLDLKEFRDEKHKVNDFLENEEGSLVLENKYDELANENSLHENLSTEECCQDVSSQSSLSELKGMDSTKENSFIQSKSEDVFHLDTLPMSPSSGMSDPYRENSEEKGNTELKEFKTIQEDLCEVQENAITVSNKSYDVAEDMQNANEHQKNLIETANLSSARKYRRKRSQNCEEDKETSPPTSPEVVSSLCTSNRRDQKFVTLLMDNGMDDDHNTMLYSGKVDKEQKVDLKDFCKQDEEVENVVRGPGTEQDRKTIEGFSKKEPLPRQETGNPRISENTGENGVRRRSEQHNDFISQTISEEVEDLKQQLKKAMQKIEELQLENKEMKKQIQNLSSSTAEEAFLVKTTKFTDRLLREMKEREAKVQIPRRTSALEKYGSEREYSYPGLKDLSQLGVAEGVRRKTSMPLRIIGAKLKEITRSVENMAMDPDVLCEETSTNVFASDFVDYKSRFLNGHFEQEDSLINSSESSKTLTAQIAPFEHDNPEELLKGRYTSVEKLGEEIYLPQTKPQQQFTAEKDCPWKDNGFKLTEGLAHERCVYQSPCSRWKLHSDTRDYVQRYVVRSSAHIAKMRDLTPEELDFYSKLS